MKREDELIDSLAGFIKDREDAIHRLNVAQADLDFANSNIEKIELEIETLYD